MKVRAVYPVLRIGDQPAQRKSTIAVFVIVAYFVAITELNRVNLMILIVFFSLNYHDHWQTKTKNVFSRLIFVFLSVLDYTFIIFPIEGNPILNF